MNILIADDHELVRDTIDHIDLPHMLDITKLAGMLVRDLGDTDLDLAGLRAHKGCGV